MSQSPTNPGNGAGNAPTLDEVARLAGVSRATASRAINGGNRVSPAAKAAVDAAVRSLGYTPNPAARSLVTRRTDSVALVVPEPDERVFTDPFFVHTLRSVNRVLAPRDLQLVLLLARPGDEERRMLRYLGRRHIDGAVVVSHHSEDRLAEHFASLGLPCAFVGRPWSGADKVPYVDTDNTAGARLAAERLVQRGCRRIGTIAGPVDMAAGIDRLDGWRSAVQDAGLADDAIAHGDFTEVGGARAAAELLATFPDLDGIFVASDLMAAGALAALAAAGRRVPDDVAVIGYDDLGVAERCTPPLTTVRQPLSEMAEQATRLLLEQIDGDRDPQPIRVIFPPALVVRKSG
ncbi:LacI family DNA-binding transcriptional regulator [Nocardioides bizhenqiangii]|uniref:LacI family DNA-binding transcriptional regulator n=1 Tax=Nocardioides bizhenqiangii TaxID=3095076 RepID=A0ABZ0ZND2_9ACTN|nr:MULTISPECIES: LacI family DNA-binding transcriptional regulator [unclassified Nocardioides]MDZ5621256.1 LacI family DNA-binding transcriptional regulator [Nocardioides sp. HM23]WQQ25901.1 LacI family DNA-binding transcriptional regulator [Nocardioides sp. HM61]